MGERKQDENGNRLPVKEGFSVDHMNPSADPITDFYNYSAGHWLETTAIPSDKPWWGSFVELRERNLATLGEILEGCLEESMHSRDGMEAKLGRLYRSAMDRDTIEKAGLSPVSGYLDQLEKISSIGELRKFLAFLHRIGISPLFGIDPDVDKKDSDVYVLHFRQGGLGLPNRDYYLLDKFRESREYYEGYIGRIHTIYGKGREDAEKAAASIIGLETEMAGNQRTPAELRDSEKNYNPYEAGSLDEKFPSLAPGLYLQHLSVPPVEKVIICQPEYFQYLDKLFKEENLALLKSYFQWIIMNSSAPFMFSRLEDESFDMYSRKLTGQDVPEPRWKKAVHIADQFLGEALGELYVKKYFGDESRKRMETLVNDIKEVFTGRIRSLSWMGEATKEQALKKFERFRAKIGHPSVFRDYSAIEIKEDDLAGNIRRAAEFEIARRLSRVGKEVDREEWYMTPPTVNAYFSPPKNEIVFPAGILQPPFFDPEMDDAVNYGGIGCVISHEITHGYDDQGSRYDLNGNLNDWWTEEDRKNFLAKADEIVKLYSSHEIYPGFHVNGELTLGENIADLGAVSIAYEALQKRLEKDPSGRGKIDGLTPEQRFYISWAQIWKSIQREQFGKMLLSMDPHSPNQIRATVPAYNHPEFEKAFSGGRSNSKQNGKGRIGLW